MSERPLKGVAEEEELLENQESLEDQPQGSLTMAALSMSQAPWWVVSVSFHGLAILLLSLIAFVAPKTTEEELIVTTSLEKRTDLATEVERRPADSASVLVSKVDVPPTDPTATNESNILVPPEILARAELGDHWETNNPDRPDTHDAFGNPEAHVFYSETGNPDEAGGGGNGGDTLDDLIGVGGGASPGTGGGLYGGDGTGFGTDSGPGKGTFGSRTGGGRKWMVMKHHGSPATESGVERGLKWLATHQEADGHWDTVKYSSDQKTDTACTGLALLAFLSAGHTEKVGMYKENVRKAVAWLKSKQNAEGLIFDDSDAGAHRGRGYPHAIAGMAMAEAAGMGRNPDTKAAAQKAIDYSTNRHQNGEGYEKRGFRYSAKQEGDLSVTGWYAMQLKSAKVAGLNVDHGSFEGVIKFLDACERKGAGADKGYGAGSSYGYTPTEPHENTAHRLTAIGNLCRQFMGWKKEDLQASVTWFVEKGGVPDGWGEGKTDLYYWYYGTMCAFQQGGDVWKRWNEAMKKTLVENQQKGGDNGGSWDPVGDFSKEWGRVGQTALCVLTLEVYYRWLPIYRQ